MLDSGRRLDMSKPGSGLGLTIVSDLVNAYGGALRLDTSTALGGLSVNICVSKNLAAWDPSHLADSADIKLFYGCFRKDRPPSQICRHLGDLIERGGECISHGS